jgi:hypothetical protein
MDTTTKTARQVDLKYLTHSINYESYIKLVTDLLAENKVTGPVQSEALTGYSKLNLHRMQRILKTIDILPEVKSVVEQIRNPQTWLVITEGWCVDSSHILPVLHALSSLNTKIDLRILLRDENLSLMDQYLTNGARSIPKLIVFDTASGEEIFNWGPRPTEFQDKFYQMRNEGIALKIIKEDLQRSYTHDKTYSTQKDLAFLLSTAAEHKTA